MSLADSITRVPLPHDRRAAEDAIAALPAGGGRLRDLYAGTAGCSPYLCRLMERQAAWLEEAVHAAPEAVVAGILDDIAATGPEDGRAVRRGLRQAKARMALYVGLADLGGAMDLDAVTGALTRLADAAVDLAFRAALHGPVTRGKLPGAGADDLADAAGLLALAMGKMGAHELNYSSDIDLICLYDDARYADDDQAEIRAAMIKAVRAAMATLSEMTADGYVFRTDLRLRPDPSVMPVAISTTAAERYYEGAGRAWERAAFIKARPAAGDIAAGDRFLDEIRPFIWRRSLDYTTVEDAHQMRQKIREHKAPGGSGGGLNGRNVKLGSGGIREIEFFTQTRQLIAGGRDRELQVRGTRAALRLLVAKGWVRADDAATLDADYVRLREIEHRLQMVQDAQTQDLPTAGEGWQRLAMFTGQADPDVLRDELRALFERVHAMTEDFFAPDAAPSERPAPAALSEAAERLVEAWQGYPALRTARAQRIFARLQPKLMEGFGRAADPDDALRQFDGFLRGLPAGVQLFSLFEANPQLIELMVDISSTAPALARYLSAHSGVLDAVIGGGFFADWPGREGLAEELGRALAEPGLDYERQLDTARRWMKERHFRVGVHHLRGLIGPAEAAEQYSDLAEAVVQDVWAVCGAEFARKHGAPPGRGAVVLGMGSLGAHEMTAGSDLDLIVIYDAESDAESDGRRPLPARTYYARLTKALVTALSAQTAAGALYEVDMRLRPSGRQGPAATSWTAFQSYHRDDAWTWERLALTRARVLAGEPTLGADVEAFRRGLVAETRERAAILADLAEMRRRLAGAKPQAGPWDVSNGPGGLQDVALMAQAHALVAGAPVRRVGRQLAAPDGLLDAPDAAALAEAHGLFSAVKVCARLLTEGALDPDRLGQGAQAMLLRDAGAADLPALAEALAAARARAAAIVAAMLAEAEEATDE